MDILQIVGIGIIAAILSTILKNQLPEFAIFISIIAGIIIFIFVSNSFINVIKLLRIISQKANIDNIYILTIIKIVGTAYVAQFGAEICRDAGESAIASKIELAGKIIIVMFAAPIVVALLNTIINLLPK